MAYSAVCPVAGSSVTAFTVMVFCVGVPFTKGIVTDAPSPIATALAVMAPDTATAAVAPVTFAAAMVEGSVMFTAFALYVVGLPVMLKVTTVPLVLFVAVTLNPAGNPETLKSSAVTLVAYVPLLKV